jgi:Caspase domain
LAILASGSVGLFQSAFDSVFPLRLRSKRARSSYKSLYGTIGKAHNLRPQGNRLCIAGACMHWLRAGCGCAELRDSWCRGIGLSGRFAVAVGVGKAGGLPLLEGARQDAARFHDWAEAQGYQSYPVIDGPGSPVKLEQVKSVINEILKAPEIDRLLLFFSGHGVSNHTGDYWLLSNYHRDADEAVNVATSMRNARRLPIRQVALFSDACRRAGAAHTSGRNLFPIAASSQPRAADYDEFFATDIEEAAQERRDGPLVSGIFSDCLLTALNGKASSAFVDRPPSVISSVSLARWLETHVPLESGKLSGAVVQYAQNLTGWAAPNDVYVTAARAMPPPLSDRDATRGYVTLDGIAPQPRRRGGTTTATSRAAYLARQRIKEAEQREEARISEQSALIRRQTVVEGQGLHVTGAVIAEVVTPPGIDVARHDGHIHAMPDRRPVSLAIALEDGHWIPSVQLPGFAGTIVVADGRVQALNYTSLIDRVSPDAETYVLRLASLLSLGRRPNITQLRQFGHLARQSKHANPILGILAAYAYDGAGNIVGLASIADWFQALNQFVPYDVLLLGGRAVEHVPPEKGLHEPRPWRSASGFPLLTRGWSLIDGAPGAAPLASVRPGVLDGPWITLERLAGRRFADLVSEGAV